MASEETRREIALDTETTGLSPTEGHRLVEIGCVEMENRIRTGRNFHVYINPQRDMPEQAFRVHGLSEEFLSDKPLFSEVAEAFLAFVGDAKLVIHNADFDMRFINAELRTIKQEPLPDSQVFCTLKHARKTFPGSPASLDALCKRFHVDNSAREKHGALLDAELLADMYLELMGGVQIRMNLHDAGRTKVALEEDAATRSSASLAPATSKVQPIRPHAPTQEEEEAHQAFLSKLSDPLWNAR